MVEQVLEGVSPTRMELLEIRKKIILAEKGHKLLEEKRDALVEKFFNIIEKRNELISNLDEEFKDAYLSLIKAQMILGENKVEDASHQIMDIGEVNLDTDNIMGVKIPKMNFDDINKEIKPNYSFSDTCATLDEAQKKFKMITMKLIELAGLEGVIKSLTVEIEKTKRRVNVLENNLIPKLFGTRKYIEMQLEEREREDFFRRKRIKALMDSKKEKNE
jgi:V/A-type H+-transporting ATPase subunit D